MHRMVIAVLGVTVALASACGVDTKSPSDETSSPAASAAPSDESAATTQIQAQVPVPAQLQFSSSTIGGEQFSGASLAGRPAVLWFWAPWCPTCQREAPTVGQVAAANPDVRFVGVGGLDGRPAIQEFVDRYPIKDFTQLADVDGAVWTKFGVTQQPAFAFIGADGNVDVVRGTLSESALSERVSALSGA